MCIHHSIAAHIKDFEKSLLNKKKIEQKIYLFNLFSHLNLTFTLLLYLDPGFVAAPVTGFHHAPVAQGWDSIIVGMKVCIYILKCSKLHKSFYFT